MSKVEPITRTKNANRPAIQKGERFDQLEACFRVMFNTAKIGIGIMSLDRKLIDANPAWCQMFGVTREELIGQTPVVVTYPEDYETPTQQFMDLMAGKIESFWGERCYKRKNGEVFWANVTMSVVRDGNGNPLYIIGILIDIDAQKRTSAELQHSEARFRAMFDNISIGMALVDFDRRIQAVNQTLEQISGYSATELSHINIADLAFPEDREIGANQFREMVAGQRESMQMEQRYIRKNGEVFWARICYSLVRNQIGELQYLVGSMEDITGRKRAVDNLVEQEAEYRRTLEQRVEERTHELNEANLRLVNEIEQRHKAEESLASKAAEEAILAERTRLARDLHDAVTQTLFSASLIAEVLPELWDVDEAEARKSTEELRQLTRGALAEMRTLLLELRPAALAQARFPDLIHQLSEAVIGRARLPVEVIVEGDYELPPDIKVVFYRIAQESLNNIIKYARATQVLIRIRLDYCKVHMEIKDNGVGFDLASIKPTSLGMRIMRERAEGIHAHFDISSAPGQGATVRVDWNEDELIPISNLKTRGEA